MSVMAFFWSCRSIGNFLLQQFYLCVICKVWMETEFCKLEGTTDHTELLNLNNLFSLK